jgi:hypothetical protein
MRGSAFFTLRSPCCAAHPQRCTLQLAVCRRVHTCLRPASRRVRPAHSRMHGAEAEMQAAFGCVPRRTQPDARCRSRDASCIRLCTTPDAAGCRMQKPRCRLHSAVYQPGHSRMHGAEAEMQGASGRLQAATARFQVGHIRLLGAAGKMRSADARVRGADDRLRHAAGVLQRATAGVEEPATDRDYVAPLSSGGDTESTHGRSL